MLKVETVTGDVEQARRSSLERIGQCGFSGRFTSELAWLIARPFEERGNLLTLGFGSGKRCEAEAATGSSGILRAWSSELARFLAEVRSVAE